MTGTNLKNDGLNDPEKLNAPSMEDIADAIQKGDHEALDRLMAVEESSETPEVPSTNENASAEPESTEEEGKAEDKDAEQGEEEESSEEQSASPTEAATPAASPANPTPDTEIEDLRRELHRYKSDAGRVPHMQRRMAELERELRAYKVARGPGNPNGEKPQAPTNVQSVELDEETQAQIEALKEVDPVAAKTIERVAKAAVAAANSRIEQSFNTFVSDEQQAEDERFYMEQKSILSQMVPQHEQIFATPEWQQWKSTLSPGRRAMAESGYADEVAQAIYAFAADMQRQQQTPAAPVQQQQAPTPIPSAPETSEVAKARSRKVANTPTAANPAARKETPFDEAAIFENAYGEIAKSINLIK